MSVSLFTVLCMFIVFL